MNNIERHIGFVLLLLIYTGLTACGSSGSSGGATNGSGTGQVVVTLTDGPTDQYERVLITLNEMILIGDNGQTVIYDGAPLTFDLLQLRDRADLAFSQTIAAGEYSKIRLRVSDIRLIDIGDPGNPADDIEETIDRLPANGKIDLNPRGPFTVAADQTTIVELDIDAKRSFQVVTTGNGKLKFRPIIFIDVMSGNINLPTRITRVFGTVDAVDPVAQTLDLCGLTFVALVSTPPAASMEECVRVSTTGASLFADNGDAIDFNDFVDTFDSTTDMQLTAIGFTALPQPNTPDNIMLFLDAVVGEIGPRRDESVAGWETIGGTLTGDLTNLDCVTDNCIEFLPRETGTDVTTQLLPQTRVFRSTGEELSIADLASGQQGTFDALLTDNNGTEELIASLFVVAPDDSATTITGVLTGYSAGDAFDTLTITPEVGDPLFACINDDTDLLQVLTNGDGISIVDVLDPAILDPTAGLAAEVSGSSGVDAACDIDATVVVVE